MNTRSFGTVIPDTPDGTAIVRVAADKACGRQTMAARAWLIVLALLAAAAPVQSQSIPVIGGYTWVYEELGLDTVPYEHIRFRSLNHIPTQGHLVSGVTYAYGGYWKFGAIAVLDENTGRVLRIDSVCPRADNQSIRSAWLNHSGTVMCYTCMDEPPHLVEYPSMREIEDTVLLKKDSLGRWFWSEARVSSTGRYLILYQAHYPTSSRFRLWLYDRVTGELTTLDRYSGVNYNSLEKPIDRPQFSGDDRLLVTRDESSRGLTVWDVAQRREIGSLAQSNEVSLYMLSHTGGKLLVSTVQPTWADEWSFAAVYDAWTMTREWYIVVENFPFPRATDHRGALSWDGKEVILEQLIQTDTGLRRGYYWYAPPDTKPRGFITQCWDGWWLQPTNASTGFIGGLGQLPVRYEWNTAMSITTPPESTQQPLYPNPTAGEVNVDVGECRSEVWRLKLSDQTGTLILERTEPCQNGLVRTSLPSLPAGQYYVQLREPLSGRSVHTSIIIQR